ncbi:hypothetical protein GCM10010168_71290 [Actinoplanes ianthinogenes]|uniref:Uncharacterized protein n=1 Tax=Actinoplanes ianthinogenes TaxID=122358 RepID=A0ABM7M6K0_9ACTN|nr:hypothetical protein Aiant_79390 [Actinoplanes ianthinogenes]GGR42274.1 hypothetical protein GCM10010168_71290 [Actinoplanes ianthinogenes]
MAPAGIPPDRKLRRAPGAGAAEVRFADAYPHLVQLASGEVAYGFATGRALGRSALWDGLGPRGR